MKLKIKQDLVETMYGALVVERLNARRQMLNLSEQVCMSKMSANDWQLLHKTMQYFNELSELVDYLWLQLEGER